MRRDTFGFLTVARFGKYHFLNSGTKINNRKDSKNLFIQTPNNVPEKASRKKIFNILNGNATLVAYE